MFDEAAAGDDHLQVSKGFQILQRILGRDDQVCSFAFFNGTGDGIDIGQFGAPFGGGVEGEYLWK